MKGVKGRQLPLSSAGVNNVEAGGEAELAHPDCGLRVAPSANKAEAQGGKGGGMGEEWGRKVGGVCGVQLSVC